MALLQLFKLSKLKITAFTAADRHTYVPGKYEFEAQYNPETLSLKHESLLQEQKGAGTGAGDPTFISSRSRQLTVNLVLDGTQVDHFGVERLLELSTVSGQVADFLSVCYGVQGSTHEPAYLRLSWGSGVLGDDFDCRLQSVDVKYTSFERDGTPLHAELTAQFVEALDPKKRDAALAKHSPDLTHRRLVVAGDTLPLLCREIYGSAEHYIRVAEVNELDDFRRLIPGQELFFPPFAANVRS